jgi:hypothetical protein
MESLVTYELILQSKGDIDKLKQIKVEEKSRKNKFANDEFLAMQNYRP